MAVTKVWVSPAAWLDVASAVRRWGFAWEAAGGFQVMAALWVWAISLAQIPEVSYRPLLFANLGAAGALTIGAFTARASGRAAWSAVVLVGVTLLVGALVWTLRTAAGEEVLAILAAPLQNPVAGGAPINDGQRVAGVALDCALALGAFSSALGLRRGTFLVRPLVPLIPVIAAALAIVTLGNGWWDLLPGIALLAASFPVGRRVARLLVGERESDAATVWIVEIAVGLSVISTLWLLVGSVGWFTAPVLAISIALLVSLCWRDVLAYQRLFERTRHALLQPVDLRANPLGVACGAVLSGVGLMTLIAALGPDLGADSGNNHLAIAAVFARQGSLAPNLETHMFFWHLPVQVLYGGMVSWSGSIAAKDLHFELGVLCAAGAASLASRLNRDSRSGLLAAAIFAVTSLAWWVAAVGYVDLAVTFLSLAIVCATIRWYETGRTGWAALAGACVGVAMPAKLTSIIFAPVVGLAIVVRKRSEKAQMVRALLLSGIAGLVVWMPWLVRSELLSGNPIFPWLNQIFRSPYVEPVSVYAGIQFGIGTSLGALLELPFATTFHNGQFVEVGRLGAQYLALGILVLIALWRPWPSAGVVIVAGSAIVFGLGWAYGMLQNLRYLLPALPLMAVLLALAYRSAARLRPHPVLVGSVAFTLLASAEANALDPGYWWFKLDSGSALPYRIVLGDQLREDFLRKFLRDFGAVQYLNRTYGEQAQIWAPHFGNRLYSEAPIFFFNDIYTALPMREQLVKAEVEKDPAVLSRSLLALGFTHLIVNESRPEFSLPESARPAFMSSAFLDHYAELEFAQDGANVYRLLPEQDSVGPSFGPNLLKPLPASLSREGSGWVDAGKPIFRDGVVGVDANDYVMSAPADVQPGLTYRVSIVADSVDPKSNGWIQVDFRDAEGKSLPATWVPYTPRAEQGTYVHYESAPPEARTASVLLGSTSPEPTVWIGSVDLAAVQDSPPPGAGPDR